MNDNPDMYFSTNFPNLLESVKEVFPKMTEEEAKVTTAQLTLAITDKQGFFGGQTKEMGERIVRANGIEPS